MTGPAKPAAKPAAKPKQPPAAAAPNASTRPATAPLRKRRRGTLLLPLVVLCFVGSAGVRLLGGTGAALAEGVEKLLPAALHGTEGAHGTGPAMAEAQSCPADPELAPILDRLAARETRLAASEKALAERQQTLAVAETRISARLEELKSAEEKLSRTMARTSVAAEDDLSKLTAVYETMKPKDAVQLFEAMAPEFAAGFLARMRPDAAGAIMSGMTPEKAYAVSVILAGRNATVPVPPAAPAVAAPAAAHE